MEHEAVKNSMLNRAKIKARYFLNGPTPASFYSFLSVQTHITVFATNKCEKCPSSIQCRDSILRPLEHESPPITTRPGQDISVEKNTIWQAGDDNSFLLKRKK